MNISALLQVIGDDTSQAMKPYLRLALWFGIGGMSYSLSSPQYWDGILMGILIGIGNRAFD